ncbi:MAG: alkaline phosphatase family protein [Myxococcales bacterium]
MSDDESGRKPEDSDSLEPPAVEAAQPTNPSSSDGVTGRRDFFKASAAASAALVSGCIFPKNDDDTTTPPPPGPDTPFKQFDHFVVVMFENRSFDSLLGYCYPAGEPRNQMFNGLAGKEFRNPVPDYIDDGNKYVANRVSPGTDADMQNPNPDPGEEYQHVNTALYSIVDPPENAFRDASEMLPPYNAPPPGTPATMDGFVWDYCNNFRTLKGRNPTFDEYRVIMDSFSPEQLPVINTLAKEFAVYDAWFCAVPTETIPNRSFFHASSSSGFVVNEPYSKWLANDALTIFNRLSEAGISWAVYYDESQVVPLTALLHGLMLVPFWRTNFYTMTEFYQHVQAGTLPTYAFVEPRMLYNNNDYHPPAPLSADLPIGGWSDVRAGDQLVYDVYTAVKNSAAQTGSNALNTLLLLTFDEHGNCFDHVAPPPATTPQNPQPEGELGFMFDRLGLRVPAIVISAYTQANTVINRPLHHAALVRTLCQRFGLSALTDRDRDAPDLADAINLDAVRVPSSWPSPTPRPVPPPPSDVDGRPLNDLEQTIVGLALSRFAAPGLQARAMPSTVGDAQAMLRSLVGDTFKHD